MIQPPCNPNNPYDWCGSVHNYLVSYLFANYGTQWQQVQDLTQRQALIKANTTSTALQFYGINVDLSCLDKVYGNTGLYSQIDFSTYPAIFNNMVTNQGLPASDAENIINFFNTLTALPTDTDIDVANALLAATEIENTFLSDSNNLSNQNVLGCFAVAKYSLYLVQTSLNNPPVVGMFKWWRALADAVGGCIGGALSGGAGILGGAAAGTAIFVACGG